MSDRTLVVVVTGLSGAGKSTAIDALEDVGFFCVDNLPPPLVGSSLDAFAQAGVRRIGLGMDVRVRHFLESSGAVLDALPSTGHELVVVFLDATDDALLRRFSSTRRPHPLSTAGDDANVAAAAVLDGIRIERERLAPLRARATLVIDTTRLSVHDLRRRVTERFGPGAVSRPRLRVRLLSFGFKYGLPVDADLVFDVRFLENPYFVPELRGLSGLDEPVRRFVLAQPDALELRRQLSELLTFLIPRAEREGKAYFTIAVGCTGGRHRSVVLAEELAAGVAQAGGPVDVLHRDVDREQERLELSAIERRVEGARRDE